jgi:glycosyltransferase involved in cell wall biosynthesis
MDVCLNIFKKIEVSHSACPIKLFEYLAMKKPVISTRLKEVERIDEYFILYADTVDECVRAIKMLVENKSTAVNYAQRGFDIILQKYSWGKAVELLLNLIEEAKVKKKSEVVH